MPIYNPCSDDPVGAHLAQFANPLQPYSVNSPNVPRLTGAVARRLPDMRDKLAQRIVRNDPPRPQHVHQFTPSQRPLAMRQEYMNQLNTTRRQQPVS